MHRTYVRRRALVVFTSSLLIAAISGPISAAVSTNRSQHLRTSTETPTAYVVRDGDTLWSIATSVAPDRDPRETLSAIRTSNPGIPTSLEPGEVVSIPVDI